MPTGSGAQSSARSLRLRRARRAAVDGGIWIVALCVAVWLRHDFNASWVHARDIALVAPVVLGGQWLIGGLLGLYVGRWMNGSFEELPALACTVAATTVVLVAVDLVADPRPIPLSAAIVGGVLAFMSMGAARSLWRHLGDRRRRPRGAGRTPVLVFGAGDGGGQAVRVLSNDPDGRYEPVALLDDDPEKLGLSIRGVRVVGTRADIGDAANRFGARSLLIAVPTADSAMIRDLLERADRAGLDVQILPAVGELLDGVVRIVDIREPNEVDLLGRNLVETDIEIASEYLSGRVVAVTGAGGSIGSELCRQVWELGPERLVMIDRDESALHAVQMSLEGRALLDSPDVVLLDIRDRDRVARLFRERRPDVVFHAAALKHLPLLESYPVEALKTNVWGTRAVLDAAADSGVERFVNISTDKAANPCSVLGYSKRIGEGLTAHQADATGRAFLSVRFGNVLKSRGSVLTAFRAQISAGGPITVTDPEVKRFFMTVEEAVELVIQAGAIGRGGEVGVLEMGEQVRIADVARRLAMGSNPPIAIEFTGLRPGEKLEEELFSDGECKLASEHPLITFVDAPALDPALVRNIDPDQGDRMLAAALLELCGDMATRLGSLRSTRADDRRDGLAAVS